MVKLRSVLRLGIEIYVRALGYTRVLELLLAGAACMYVKCTGNVAMLHRATA